MFYLCFLMEFFQKEKIIFFLGKFSVQLSIHVSFNTSH